MEGFKSVSSNDEKIAESTEVEQHLSTRRSSEGY